MSSSVSLLPTIEFLEQIASVQFGTESSYGVGLSKLKPEFFSTTNSEWLCLNSESEFLTSSIENIKIKNPFEYPRNSSLPVHIAINNLLVKSKVLNNTNSVFLYRLNGTKQEIITVSNYDKNSNNVTTAPPLDCFSRECLSWFSSDNDWFTGFGTLTGSLSELILDSNGIIINKSEDILLGLIESSTQSIPYTSIEFNPPTTESPFVSINFSTEVEYVKTESTPSFNVLFLFNSNSTVAFAANIEGSSSSYYNTLETQVSFNNQEIIII